MRARKIINVRFNLTNNIFLELSNQTCFILGQMANNFPTDLCFVAEKCGELKRCGVTKTISPPSIKLEPPEDPNQSMLPDSSSDLRHGSGSGGRHKHGQQYHHRVKTEFEVKQEPCWEGEVTLNNLLQKT